MEKLIDLNLKRNLNEISSIYVFICFILLVFFTSFPSLCEGKEGLDEQAMGASMAEVDTKVKEQLSQDTSMTKAREHLEVVKSELQKLKVKLKNADINPDNISYKKIENVQKPPSKASLSSEKGITKNRLDILSKLEIVHPQEWVRDTIGALIQKLAAYNQNDPDTFGKFWLDDLRDKRVLIHTSLEAIGTIDLSPKYKEMFKEILDQLPNPNEFRLVIYTYKMPRSGESMGLRYAWAGYDDELNLFYGISMPYLAMPKVMNLVIKYSTEEIKKKERAQNLILGISITSILFLLLILSTISLHKIRGKNKLLRGALGEKNKFLQAAENASCYIVLVDEENVIRWANAKFKNLYSNGDAIVGSDFFSISSYDKDKLRRQIKLMRNATNEKDKRFTYRSELEGRTMQSELTVLDAEHTKDWLVLIDTDVTELEQARKKQMNLFHAASHDIKTPLLGPYTVAEKILRETPEDFKYRIDIEKILIGITHAFDIVKNFKDSSQYEVGNIAFSSESIKLSEVVEKSRRVHQTYLKVSKVDLVNEVPEELEIHGDRIRLESIINNLLSNAVRTIKNRRIRTNEPHYQGKVQVFAEEVENQVLFTVEDNGEGLSVERAKNLFSTANIKKGLGTYLIKSFIQDHGKNLKIMVNSTLKVGTSISMQLPK